MTNLIGYLKEKLSRFNSSIFLTSLFSTIFLVIILLVQLPNPVYSAGLSVSTTTNYYLDPDGNLTASIDCSFISPKDEILTFLTIGLPFLEVSNVSLSFNNSNYETAIFNQDYQTNVVLDLNETTLPRNTIKTFRLIFSVNDWLDTSTGHFTFPLLITGTNQEQVKLEISKDIGNYQLATDNEGLIQNTLVNKNLQYTIANPLELTQLYFLFGESFSYEFSIDQFFSNNGDAVQYYEVPLPHQSNELTLIINSASGDNITYRKDGENNLFAGITVEPSKSVNLSISGEVIITKSNINSQRLTTFEIPNYLTTNTFWEITDVNSNRFTAYLQANGGSTTTFTYEDLVWSNSSLAKYTKLTDKYIKEKLNIATTLDQLQEDVRIPADLALEQSLVTAANYSDVAMAILRNANIPTRQVTGYVSKVAGEFTSGFMHTWTEYWTIDEGWITFDPAYGELSGLSGHAIALSDHIPLIIRVEHPLKPNSGILSPDSVNFEYSTTFSSPINNLTANVKNLDRKIYEGSVSIPIEITNKGNQAIETTSLIINEKVIVLHDSTNLLMPGTTETYYYEYIIAESDLSKDTIEQTFSLNYQNELHSEQDTLSITITASQPWWWNYAFYSVSALIVVVLSFVLFYLYNKRA